MHVYQIYFDIRVMHAHFTYGYFAKSAENQSCSLTIRENAAFTQQEKEANFLLSELPPNAAFDRKNI